MFLVTGQAMADFVEYRDITGFPCYQVGSDGSIRKHAGGEAWRHLSPIISADGYNLVNLTKGGVKRQFRVAVLVAEAFHGMRFGGYVACHNNGIRTDDRIENIRWDTPAGNEADKRKHGTAMSGEGHINAKLTASDVAEIRRLLADGVSKAQLGRQFGVTSTAIYHIAKGRNWSVA
jgi:hypothetical protein